MPSPTFQVRKPKSSAEKPKQKKAQVHARACLFRFGARNVMKPVPYMAATIAFTPVDVIELGKKTGDQAAGSLPD